MHGNININLGKQSAKITNGVPQGLTSPPALFDIYIEELLGILEANGMKCFAYADDLAFTASDVRTITRGINLVE